MQNILLALIAGLLLTQIVDKTDSRTNEVWGKYLMILVGAVIALIVAFIFNAILLNLGVNL